MSEKKKMSRKRRLIKRVIIIWGVLGVVGLVGIVYALINWVGELCVEQEETGSNKPVLHSETISESESGFLHVMPEETIKVPEEIIRTQTFWELYEANKELLVLVNREHALEDDSYRKNLRNICHGRLQASKALYDDLVELLAAAGEAGYEYWIASAYRSRERQQELVDEDVARYMAQGMSRQQALKKTYEQTMPAGYSEHETGLALDILCSENLNMDATQAAEPGNQWLMGHAHEYGFILRYPEGAEEITGIFYEPWHFRYVGKEAAIFLREHELTLEEFWEILEQ